MTHTLLHSSLASHSRRGGTFRKSTQAKRPSMEWYLYVARPLFSRPPSGVVKTNAGKLAVSGIVHILFQGQKRSHRRGGLHGLDVPLPGQYPLVAPRHVRKRQCSAFIAAVSHGPGHHHILRSTGNLAGSAARAVVTRDPGINSPLWFVPRTKTKV
jgi:hypothetical protein